MSDEQNETPQQALENSASIYTGDVTGGTFTITAFGGESDAMPHDISLRDIERTVESFRRRAESQGRHRNLPPRRRRVKHSL